MELEAFVNRIEDFSAGKASEKIDFFSYFLQQEKLLDGVSASNIRQCFDDLHLHAYSNIPSYLSAAAKGKNKKYLKKGDRYYLERSYKQELEQSIGVISLPTSVSSTFFPIALFADTRGYLLSVANQTLASYNNGIYDGCSVLTRKLIEILIIECFERHGVESLIKKPDGTFFYLSDLIGEFLKEPKWSIGRNAKAGLPKVKKLGDQSAHNRRYVARKQDLDGVQDELRVIIEELVHLIDYPNWKK